MRPDIVELRERLRATKRTGYQLGGAMLSSDGSSKKWGGEPIMSLVNPDGPKAADTITALLDQIDALTKALESIFAHYEKGVSPGNAPGHCHSRPGIWDDDLGNMRAGRANLPCQWCADWSRARQALETTHG